MKYEAHITKVETEETRIYHGEIESPTYEYGGEYPDGFLYLWEDGNFSCDCNREILFERSSGVEIDNEKCSQGRFTVKLLVDGKIAYQE